MTSLPSAFRHTARPILTLFIALLTCPSLSADPEAAGGWQVQTYPLVRAVQSVHISHRVSHSGRASLGLEVQLDGASRTHHEGEAFVDLRYYGPDGVDAPADFAGHAVTAWVMAPPALQGPARSPNGFRLFVKDSHWRSEYGPWNNCEGGKWVRIALTPSAAPPDHGSRDASFDPHHLVLIGVSVASGRGSTTHFDGEVNLDDVSWDGHLRYGFED